MEEKKVDERVEVKTNSETDTTPDYISAINEIKANSVSKEDYLKLKEENKKLLKSIVNGENLEASKTIPTEDISELRNKLFGQKRKDLTNLEFVETALKLRTAIMEDGGVDPFVPIGTKIKPTDEDFNKASKVAKVLQECVDYADGNPDVFTDELKRNIK